MQTTVLSILFFVFAEKNFKDLIFQQALFSSKGKSKEKLTKIIKMSSAAILLGSLRVKNWLEDVS